MRVCVPTKHGRSWHARSGMVASRGRAQRSRISCRPRRGSGQQGMVRTKKSRVLARLGEFFERFSGLVRQQEES